MSAYDDDENEQLEEINDSVTRVELAVRSLEKAIESKWSSIQAIGYIFVIVFFWEVLSGMWNSKYRYAITETIDSSKVVIDKKPHDCDFFSAPLGNKYCRYDKEVYKVLWATSVNGNPIRSDDDGKTWVPFTPPDPTVTIPKTATTEQVYVTWKKVEE